MSVSVARRMDKIICLHPEDNVSIAREPLPANLLLDQFSPIVVKENIPAMHKVALRDIKSGEAVIKYRQTIGIAKTDIMAGAHVHTQNCTSTELSKNYEYCTETVPLNKAHKAGIATFMGYRRKNGKTGTRNFIGILTSVNCSATVARQIASTINNSNCLKSYPNIDGIVALTHGSGCGMSGSGDGYKNLMRVIRGYANHPNFGGVLLVGLGCEVMQSTALLDQGIEFGNDVKTFNIQESGGSRKAIERGVEMIEAMLPEVNAVKREETPASELTVALQCGGSDAYSGITANPALGAAVDLLVQQGGTAILSETPELYGAEHLMTKRAANRQVADALIERIQWWESYTKANGDELNNNPSPGNKAGGLTTILEKSLGAMAKGGSTNLNGVFQYAEPIGCKGLVIMDSPGFDPASVTGQVAAGATVVCFTTGRGSAFGFKPSPTIKLATNTPLYTRMNEDMDINCGDIADGQCDIQTKGAEIFKHILRVASGNLTKSEELNYGDNEFTPWQIGSVI